MPAIDRTLIRRVARVSLRMADDDPPDAIMDDFFVLWRAFEGSWPLRPTGTHTSRCRHALDRVISTWSWSDLPSISRFVSDLSMIERFSHKELKMWFELEWSESDRFLDDVAVLRDHAGTSVWNQNDTFVLADLFYKMRCAVVHSSLDTVSASRVSLLPRAREALLQTAVMHGAALVGACAVEAANQLGAELERLNQHFVRG